MEARLAKFIRKEKKLYIFPRLDNIYGVKL